MLSAPARRFRVSALQHYFRRNRCHDAYSDKELRDVLSSTKTLVMVGASPKPNRPSFFAMQFLQEKGYRVIPVNPVVAKDGGSILGEPAFGSLADLPSEFVGGDCMLDIFRATEAALPVAEEGAELGFRKIWLQLGVRDDEAAARLEERGCTVVQNRCPKIEISRLEGQLGLHGFVGTPISSKRRRSLREGGSDGAGGVKFDGFETKAIHQGAVVGETGARTTPIYQTTSFVFDSADHAAQLFDLSTFGNIYSRLSNPTAATLEERIAALEGGTGGTATASGHSAQLLCLFALLGGPGGRLVASNRLYGGSITQFGRTISRFGWETEFVDIEDLDQVRSALAHPQAKLLWTESLANPGGVVADLRALADACDDAELPLVVDNTLATPYLCRPLEHGASVVVHSTTKFLSGHGNAMGGCVVDGGTFDWSVGGKYPALTLPEPAYHGLVFLETFGIEKALTTYLHAVGLRDLGPCMAPMNAFLTITGVETLAVRMDRHCDNAQAVAEFLDAHPAVEWVSFPGLSSSPHHALAKQYLARPGAVLSFGVRGGYEAGKNFVEACELFSHLANVGDVRSLVLHPASTTHRQLTEEQRVAAGASDETVRLSIGLETASDLLADLDAALGKSAGA